MIKHFFWSYYRYIKANKRHAIVNYTGLSFGIAVILLMFLFVKSELTYDGFHENSDRIFRLTTKLTTPGGEYNVAFANTGFVYKLREELSDIENIACISESNSFLVKHNDQIFREDNIRYATPGTFEVFSYRIIKGNPVRLLAEPNTAVLTETLSKKLFKENDPIGEIVLFNDQAFTVTGVIKDLPVNTDLKFTALLASPVNGSEDIMAWIDYYSYILVKNDYASDLQDRIDKIAESAYKPFFTGDYAGLSRTYKIQPLISIHFDTSYLADTPKGNKTTVYIFLCIACVILIIACINYINLNLAGSMARYKEFAIRKINGSGKSLSFIHLICDSVLNAFISLLLSIFIAALLLPAFNKLTDANFSAQIFTDVSMILMLLIVMFIISISGVFPSVYMLRLFKSSGNTQSNRNNGFGVAGKLLVTFQFVLSIAMISVIIGVSKQNRYMQRFDLGFNKDQILSIDLSSVMDATGSVGALKQELSSRYLVATGRGGTRLGASGEWMKPIYEVKNESGQDVQLFLNMPEIDENYIDVFGIKLIEGRNFSKDHPTDYDESIIINQTYAEIMSWKSPLNKKMAEDSKLRVIGVVSDFHFASLHNKIEPLAFRFNDNYPSYLFLKVPPSEIDHIKTVWQKYFTETPFEYKFVDENFDNQYQKDKKQQALFGYLSFLAILISALGLYGLSSFFITRRIKEIGIRRVNGAKVGEILFMLNKDFVKWVFLAFIVATPIAWYAMNKWLQHFAYKADLSWWIFASAGTVAVAVALLTVSWQSWTAATRNPVDALRYE